MAGTEVEVPNRLTMIGVIWTPANAMVATLGQTDKLCATTEEYRQNAWANYVFPSLAEVPVVADEGACDVQAIVEIEPCVTLADAAQQEYIDEIRAADWSAMDVGFDSFDGMKQAMNAVAEAIGDGASDVAASWAELFDKNVRQVSEALEDLPAADHPSVLHVIDKEGVLYASGSGGIVQDWIEAAGGVNAVGANAGDVEITREMLAQAAPDVVIVGGSNARAVVEAILADAGISTGMLGSVASAEGADGMWNGVPAIASLRVVPNPAGISAWDGPTPEMALQVLWAAEQLHPDRVDHSDVVTATRDFYETFYGFRISKCDAVGILECKQPDAVPDCDEPEA